ncbi:MAG: hypothetical protein ACO3N9_07025, partial [Alphaproteobacteria bacterium]
PPPVVSANIQVELIPSVEQKDKKPVKDKKVPKKSEAKPILKEPVTPMIDRSAREPLPELPPKNMKKAVKSGSLPPIPKKKPRPKQVKKIEKKKLSALIPAPKRKPIRKSKPEKKPQKSNTAAFKSLLKDLKAEKKKDDQTKFTKILKGLETEKRQLKETNETKREIRTNSLQEKPISSLDRQKKISQLIVKIQNQLSRCWNIPTGAKNLERLKVEVRIMLNPDGSLRSPAKIADPSTKGKHSAYQVLAESAVRALNDPDCMPLKLPLEEYQVWKDIAFNFDARAALGQ